jgi:uncharacterized membrane protein YphA (DoxX/SURF4 family)
MNPLRILRLVLRLGLGAVFVYAAWLKLSKPWLLFAMDVDAYQVLPHWAVLVVARTLPWAELALGLMLIAGLFQRIAAPAVSLLLAGFFTLMLRSYFAGMQINCGCFGPDDVISIRTLARDGSLLVAALALTALVYRKPAPRPS